MDALRVGQHALLVQCAEADDVVATYRTLREHAAELGATEVVPAARTVLLDGLSDPDLALSLLADLLPAGEVGTASPQSAEVVLRTVYDGADLDEVARQWQTSTAEVVRLHQEAAFVVRFCGFAPGFAYCTGLPDGLSVARRRDPRPSVPAGSVALAGEFTGVYPRASPGGWQLIGRTAARLWRPETAQPALLVPGTLVRFQAVLAGDPEVFGDD
jgi:KipI family sensor histidine kinase inhibitor